MAQSDPARYHALGQGVVFVSPSAVIGGQETIVLGLAEHLSSAGVGVEAVLLRDGPLAARFRSLGVDVTLLAAGRLRQPHLAIWSILRLARYLLRRHRQTLVCATMAKGHLYSGLAARLARRPAIWLQADIPVRTDWLQRLAAAVPADGVLAESRDALTAQRLLMRRPERAHLMHPGINVDRFSSQAPSDLREGHQIDADAPLISIVGRLQEWKGQREFLSAAAIVSTEFPTARFAVVGGAILGSEADYPQRLRELAHKLGIADRVSFTGHTDAVAMWMAESDIVVNASMGEPFGLVILEALASRCAVVAVDRGGPRDVIVDGETGLLCESNEPRHLADALLRLLRQPELRLSLAEAGCLSVQGQFTAAAMTDRFVSAVAQVNGQRQRRTRPVPWRRQSPS